MAQIGSGRVRNRHLCPSCWRRYVDCSARSDPCAELGELGSFALGPNGTVHIVGARWINDRSHVIYAERPPAGAWSDPVMLTQGITFQGGPGGDIRIAVAPDNTVHVAGRSLNTYLNKHYGIFWISKDASGVWSEPRNVTGVPRGGFQQPELAVDQTGGVHVVVTDGGKMTKYACRPAEGPWSGPIVIRRGICGGSASVGCIRRWKGSRCLERCCLRRCLLRSGFMPGSLVSTRSCRGSRDIQSWCWIGRNRRIV